MTEKENLGRKQETAKLLVMSFLDVETVWLINQRRFIHILFQPILTASLWGPSDYLSSTLISDME